MWETAIWHWKTYQIIVIAWDLFTLFTWIYLSIKGQKLSNSSLVYGWFEDSDFGAFWLDKTSTSSSKYNYS